MVLPGNRDRGSSREINKIVTIGKNRDLHQDEGPGPARAAQCRSEITVELYGMSVNTKKVSNGNTPLFRLQQVKSKICDEKKCPGGGSNTRSDANRFEKKVKFSHKFIRDIQNKTFFHTAFTASVVLLPHHETKFYPIRIILNSSSVSAVGLMTSQLTPAAAEVEDTDRQNFVTFNVAVSSQSQTAVVKPKCLGF